MLRMTLPTAILVSAVWHGLVIADVIHALRDEYRVRRNWRKTHVV